MTAVILTLALVVLTALLVRQVYRGSPARPAPRDLPRSHPRDLFDPTR